MNTACHLKQCSNCREHKSIASFYREEKAVDGASRWCKCCSNERSSTWRRKNKTLIAEHSKNRRKTDPIYRRRKSINNNTAGTLRNGANGEPGGHLRALGCSATEFYEYISRQLAKGMNWHNRNEWQLDHIVPLSIAQTLDGLDMAAHYSNVQVLWVSENQKKHTAIDTSTLHAHSLELLIKILRLNDEAKK